jgi:hypothetical protein
MAPSTFTNFKDFTAGVQSISVAVAAVFGGLWALFQFRALRSDEQANLAAAQARINLEKARVEQSQGAVVLLEMTTETFDLQGRYFLHICAHVKNVGNRSEVIDWTKASIYARRFAKVDDVTISPDNVLLPAWVASKDLEERLQPEYSASRSFLIKLPERGVYAVECFLDTSSTVAADTATAIRAATGSDHTGDGIGVYWKASTFVCVPDDGSRQTFPVTVTASMPNVGGDVPPIRVEDAVAPTAMPQ